MICLIPGGNGTPFLFSIMPEQIAVKYGAKYQTFDTCLLYTSDAADE